MKVFMPPTMSISGLAIPCLESCCNVWTSVEQLASCHRVTPIVYVRVSDLLLVDDMDCDMWHIYIYMCAPVDTIHMSIHWHTSRKRGRGMQVYKRKQVHQCMYIVFVQVHVRADSMLAAAAEGRCPDMPTLSRSPIFCTNMLTKGIEARDFIWKYRIQLFLINF